MKVKKTVTNSTSTNDIAAIDDQKHPPTKTFLRRLEEESRKLRQKAGVGPLDRLDPLALVDQLDITILTIDDVENLPLALRSKVQKLTPKQWSGAGMPLPEGDMLVLLHPYQTTERARVTTMEEVAHQHYGHEPTRIAPIDDGVVRRTFNPRVEQEAYWTAAAALLPMKAVGMAVWREQDAEDLARQYGVSVELAEFRMKILGLWNYRTRKAA